MNIWSEVVESQLLFFYTHGDDVEKKEALGLKVPTEWQSDI